ncbi:MAG: TolC family outer membrane protein [Sphingomonas sp.]|uniref:TolC family outer membrane protein n=1 Tax=Sphingomonas sp. TaxID=28214 RepID=UPI0017A52D6C|nr:TolC family outer membrane protein [Sphingomonas sp.]MBA3666956.1 TolC family outer membrane protein [Sphingomonas sp.]
MTRYFAIATLIAALAAGTASADTLREALASTYRANPTLTGQREALKSTDAGVAIARAAGRPTVAATIGVSRDITQAGTLRRTSNGPFLNGGLDLSYPLFQGGSVRNGIRAAKTRTEAGRATLRAVEGDIFTEAVAAYMDVIRDWAIVELNQNQVRVLSTNLEATRDRFQIGDLTRTDVAQSEARQSLGRSTLATAQGRLTSSEENYRRVIGQAPGALAPPPPLPPLPTSPDQAAQIALANNPDLIAVTRQAEAAGFDVRSARASRLPTVSALGSADYVRTFGGSAGFNPNTGESSTLTGTATSIGVQGRVPLYQGGLPAARIRQAQAIEGQTLEQRVATERAVVANTRAAFATYQAATNAIASNQVAVSANELALEGARAENGVGTRTILDVLNAEQELLNSQVALVTARRDQYVAGFQLLNAMGQAEADDLGLDGGPLYDPLGNYRRVAGDWNDWSGDRHHDPVATSTVTPAEQPQGVTPAPR